MWKIVSYIYKYKGYSFLFVYCFYSPFLRLLLQENGKTTVEEYILKKNFFNPKKRTFLKKLKIMQKYYISCV
jgi:hypothetical protein